jgi:hypothetical protein
MSNDDQEDLFIRRILAGVEKAERIQRIKQVAVTVIAFLAALWLAFREGGPELNIVCVSLIGFSLIAAVCTAKIMSLIEKNTKAVLTAIAAARQKS